MKATVHRNLLVSALLITGLATAVLTGCGSEGDEPSPAPDYAKKLAGAPAPLAALYKQGNELLPGGLDAYNERIAGLKGFPAVVNVWASWCGPCRGEFPVFQRTSAAMGKKVAFLGVNSDDNEDAAKGFLADHQVPYPSYSDPDKDIANDLEATHGFPATAFYNADGERTYTKSGPFESEADLEATIRQYALGDGGN